MCCPRPVHPLLAFAALAIGLLSAVASADTRAASGSAQAPLDVLAAAADNAIDVTFIPNDSRSAQVVIRNRGARPLTLRLPAGFAGVPVLAQMGMGGGMGGQGAGFGAGGIGAGAQSVGGGGMGGGMGGMGGGMGGGFCWVAREVYGVHDPRWLAFRQWMIWQAPAWMQDLYRKHGADLAAWLRERPAAKSAVRLAMNCVTAPDELASRGGLFRVATAAADAFNKPFTVVAGQTLALRVPTVCLEYGRREPTPRMPYRLEPLAKVSEDPKLAVVLGGLASGQLTQKVAQAAAWHIASGRTWEQLAAESIDRAGGDPDVPMFTAADLAAAQQAVEIATRLSAEVPAAAASSR